MRRTAVTATAVAVFVCMLAACSGSHDQRALRTTTVAPRSLTDPVRPDEVLSLSGLGTFEAGCPRSERSWTLRFVPDDEATELFSYRIGTGARRTVTLNLGNAITVHLIPNATRTYEPADRFVPPPGQPRGVLKAMSVPTTAPLQALIYQATEPQTLQADVHLALATIGGESRQCVLVGSTVHAWTYLNGHQ